MVQQHLEAWAKRVNGLAAAGEPIFLLLDFELRKPRVWHMGELAAEGINFSFPGRPGVEGTVADKPVRLKAGALRYTDYLTAFSRVQTGLRRGDSFLTNLTFAVPVQLSGQLTSVYQQSQAKYRILVPDEFCCFSPETFVTISHDGYIESRPMKGTAADTPAARTALMNDPKEIAEHATIVDLIRNDLSRVARGIAVTDYRYLRAVEASLGGLVQTSSKIGGRLTGRWRESLGDLLLQLLPAGSVSGAPKEATLDLIRAAEGGKRGYYCGIAGFYDGATFESCVLIRYIELSDGGYLFRSGGGVTALSNPALEYAELLAKVRIPYARPFSDFNKHPYLR